MPILESLRSAPAPRARGRMDSAEVLRHLQEMCAAMNPGDTVPPHHEIMQRIDASERSVRWALDELRRQGVIVRRPGARTVVAPIGGVPDEDWSRLKDRRVTQGLDKRTVVAIAEPDGGLFDQAMKVLMQQGKHEKVAVQCHLIPQEEADHFPIPPLGEGPCGYVLFRRQFLPLAQRLQEQGHRVVFVGTPYADTTVEVPNVCGDQEHGGYLAVKHLLEQGHRRIAFHFISDYKNLRRFVGCQRALQEAREAGLEVHHEMLEVDTAHATDGQVQRWGGDPARASAYFRRPDAPTAIVSWNDDMAIRMLTLLQRIGLRVPEDVSLVGYDNLWRGAEVHPALTTVDGSLDTQIQAALRLLLQPHPLPSNQSIIVMPTLVRRDSSAPIAP